MNERQAGRRVRVVVALVSVCMFALLSSCGAARRGDQPAPSAAESPRQTVPDAPHPAVVLPNGHVVDVEIAADNETREQGLMFRESVPDGKGMLFIFPATGEYPFWMKNTMIPLDMIWIDSSDKIVHIERNVPPCVADPCTSYPPHAKAIYVLEMAAGEAKKNGLEVGDHVKMRNLEHVVVR